MAVSSHVGESVLTGIRHSSLPWLAILIIAPLPILWYGLYHLYLVWHVAEFRLKGLVPVFCLAMFAGLLRSVPVPTGPVPGRWLGFGMLAGFLGLALMGNALAITHVVYVALIGYVIGLAFLIFGPRHAVMFWAPLASLTLMLPIPNFLYLQIHRFLEEVTFAIASPFLQGVGVPLLVEGVSLNFGAMLLVRDEVMDGLRNLLPLMLFFFFFATLSRLPLWLRLAPLVLALPCILGLSALRLVVIGVLTTLLEEAGVERAVALTGGWLFLVAAIILLMLLVAAIGRAFSADEVRLLPRTLLLRQRLNLRAPERSRPLVAAGVLVGLASALFALAPPSFPSSSAPARDSLTLFPPAIREWSSSREAVEKRVEEILDATEYLSLSFSNPEERERVDLWIAYYAAQNPYAAAIHSPEICLPGDGWNILSLGRTNLPVSNGSAKSLRVNRATIAKDGQRMLVYYWFEGRGRRIASEAMARMSYRVDSILIGRSDAAIVRYVTPMLPDEEESDADARLQRLVAVTVDLLPRFIPE
jgi:exosortase D (VPLPA-CTERM-specific)